MNTLAVILIAIIHIPVMILLFVSLRGWHNANLRNKSIVDQWGKTIENNGALIAQNARLVQMLRGEEPVDQSRFKIDFSSN